MSSQPARAYRWGPFLLVLIAATTDWPASSAAAGGPQSSNWHKPCFKPYVLVRLDGQGFHRQLHCTVQLLSVPLSAAEGCLNMQACYLGPSSECNIAILQPLPAEIYADPYELNRFAAAEDQLHAIEICGEADIESTALFAKPQMISMLWSNVLTHSQVAAFVRAAQEHAQNNSSCSAPLGTSAILSFDVPVHARYPSPAEQSHLLTGTFATAAICAPFAQFSRSASLGLCHGQLPTTVHPQCQVVAEWQIPAGIADHMHLVLMLTFGIASTGCLILCRSMMQG